jgi:hypothetical protein
LQPALLADRETGLARVAARPRAGCGGCLKITDRW